MDTRKSRLLQRGIDHLQSGNLDAAEASFESLLAIDPGDPVARYRLSMIAVRRGRYTRALDLIAPLPDVETRPEILVHVARCRLALGQVDAAAEWIDRALKSETRNPVLLSSLAVALGQLGNFAGSVQVFDRAIANETREPSLFFNRALVQRELGKVDAAERDLEQCLLRQPGHVMAHFALSQLKRCSNEFQHVDRLRRIHDRQPAGSPGKEALALALFKELDDLGRTEDATPYLAEAIALRPRTKLVPGDLRRWFGSIQGLRAKRAAAARPVGRTPLFLVGMPRAGSELLSGLLTRHPSIQRAPNQCGFIHHLGRFCGRESVDAIDEDLRERAVSVDASVLGQSFRDLLPRVKDGASHILFAQPMDMQLLGLIADSLPEAKFLHVSRDPVDTCLSVLAQMAGANAPPLSLPPTGDIDALGEYFRCYSELMTYWAGQFPGRILDVPYESLIDKPEMLLRVACSFIGLRFDPAMRTGPELHRQRIGHWQRHARGIGAVGRWPLAAKG